LSLKRAALSVSAVIQIAANKSLVQRA
jgi:hypothetical protein